MTWRRFWRRWFDCYGMVFLMVGMLSLMVGFVAAHNAELRLREAKGIIGTLAAAGQECYEDAERVWTRVEAVPNQLDSLLIRVDHLQARLVAEVPSGSLQTPEVERDTQLKAAVEAWQAGR